MRVEGRWVLKEQSQIYRELQSLLHQQHKVVLHQAVPQYSEFIFPAPLRNNPRGWRIADRRHNKQLYDPIDGTRSRAFQRSLFGLIYCYNLLPQTVIDCNTVSTFQNKLQNCLKRLAASGHPRWPSFFRDGVRTLSITLFHSSFN